MNEAELTILSLLAEADRYGHEIQQVIDQRGLRAWVAIGFSSVYYLLGKLENQGLVAADLHSDGQGMARKRYRLSDAGRGVLQTALSDLLRQPRALGEGFELGLANLHVLKPHQVYKTLSHHHADLQQRLTRIEHDWALYQQQHPAEFNAIKNGNDTDPEALSADNVSALYTHSIALMHAELAWLSAFLETWKARYPASDRSAGQGDEPDTESSRKTLLNRRITPDPAKMIQKLKRPAKDDPPRGE